MNGHMCNIDNVKLLCAVHNQEAQAYCAFFDCMQRLLCPECISKGHKHSENFFENIKELFKTLTIQRNDPELETGRSPNGLSSRFESYNAEISRLNEEIKSEVKGLGQLSKGIIIKENQGILELRREISNHFGSLTSITADLVKKARETYGKTLLPENNGAQTVNEKSLFTKTQEDNNPLGTNASFIKPNTGVSRDNPRDRTKTTPQKNENKSKKIITMNEQTKVIDLSNLEEVKETFESPAKKKRTPVRTSPKSHKDKKDTNLSPLPKTTLSSKSKDTPSNKAMITVPEDTTTNSVKLSNDTQILEKLFYLDWKKIIEQSSFEKEINVIVALEDKLSTEDKSLRKRIEENKRLLIEAAKVAAPEKENIEYDIAILTKLLEEILPHYNRNEEKPKYLLNLENLISERQPKDPSWSQIRQVLGETNLKEQLMDILTNNISAENFCSKVNNFLNYLMEAKTSLDKIRDSQLKLNNISRTELKILQRLCPKVLCKSSKLTARLISHLKKIGTLTAAATTSSVLWVLITTRVLHFKKAPLKIWQELKDLSHVPKEFKLISEDTQLYQAFLKEFHQGKLLQSEVNSYWRSKDPKLKCAQLVTFEYLRGLNERLERSRIPFRKTVKEIKDLISASQRERANFDEFLLRFQNGEKIPLVEFEEFEKIVDGSKVINRKLHHSIDEITKTRKQLDRAFKSVKKDPLQPNAFTQMEQFCQDYKAYIISNPSYEAAIRQFQDYKKIHAQFENLKKAQDPVTIEQVVACKNFISNFETSNTNSIFQQAISSNKEFLEKLKESLQKASAPTEQLPSSSQIFRNEQGANKDANPEIEISASVQNKATAPSTDAQQSKIRNILENPFEKSSLENRQTKIEEEEIYFKSNFDLNKIPKDEKTGAYIIDSDSDKSLPAKNDRGSFDKAVSKKIKTGNNSEINLVSPSFETQQKESDFVQRLASLIQENGFKSTKKKYAESAFTLAKLIEELFKETTLYHDENTCVAAVTKFLEGIEDYKNVWLLLEEDLGKDLLKKLLFSSKDDRIKLEITLQQLRERHKTKSRLASFYVSMLLNPNKHAIKSMPSNNIK